MGTSPYENNYFCVEERLYIPKEKAVFAINGQLLCPNNHKRRALRVGPHNNIARKNRR